MPPLPRRLVLAGAVSCAAARPAGGVTWQADRPGGRTDPAVTRIAETLWRRHGLAVRCVGGPADVMPASDGVVWRVVRLGLLGGPAAANTLAGLLRHARAGGGVTLPRAGTAASVALLHQALWELGGDVDEAAGWHREMRARAADRPGGIVITQAAAQPGLVGLRAGSVRLTWRAAAVHDGPGAAALLGYLRLLGQCCGGDIFNAGPDLPPAPPERVAALADALRG